MNVTKTFPYVGGRIEVAFNKADESPAKIQIYDDIGRDPWTGEGFTAKDVSAALNEITPKTREIHTHLNSRGGDVNEGKAIRSLFQDWPGRIVNIIDGVAASTASWMIPADETQARQHAQIFIHNSWTIAIGNSADMVKASEMLNLTDSQIADIYAEKTGKPRAEMLDLMAKETLITAETAKSLGFVDKILDGQALHNFTPGELLNMKQKLAAMNAAKISAPSQGADNQNNNPIVMNRTEMLALLNKWGTPIPENATDDQLKKLVESGKPAPTPENRKETPAPADDPTVAKLRNEYEAEVKRIKNDRITSAFNALAKTRPQLAQNRETCLANCLADEKYLDAYALYAEAPAPLNRQSIDEVTEGIIGHLNKCKTPADRYKFRIANWTELDAAYLNPRNANTTDAALVTDMLLDGATTILQNRLAPLRAFSKEVATDRVKPKAILQHRKITAGGTAQVNATSFEDTTNFVGTEENVAITINQITSGGHVTNAERQSGVKMSQWVDIKVAEFSDKIMAAVAAVILEGTYTATPLVSAAAAFGSEEMKTLWGQLKKSPIKNIILDGEYFARFIPSTLEQFNIFTVGIPGWDTVALNTNWTGATANTVGFACNPQAMVCGIGLPLRSERANLVSSESVLNLPDLGLSVAVYNWYSNITRNEWMTMDIMFGAAANDTTAAVLVKSA